MRETLAGVRVIRAFVRTRHEEERFDDASRDLFDTSLRVNRLFAITIPVMTAILNLSTVAVIWFGAIRVDSGAMPIGNLTAFLQYLHPDPVRGPDRGLHVHPRPARGRVGRPDPRGPRHRAVDPRPERRRSCAAASVERGVGRVPRRRVPLPGRRGAVLRDISFRAEPGETTAIVGSTGSGKSTLVNLIPRFYDATGGAVLVDGVDVREMDRERPLGAHRVRPPEGVPVQRHRREQPPLRRRRRHRRGAVAGARDRPGPRLRRGDGGRARGADHPGRHERLGRPAPAARDRPGARQAGRRSTSSTTASRRSTSRPTRGSAPRSTRELG